MTATTTEMRKPAILACLSAVFFIFSVSGLYSCLADPPVGSQDDKNFLTAVRDSQLIFDDGNKLVLPGLRDTAIQLLVFVRHAEKDTIGYDPGLSPDGEARVQRLERILAGMNYGKVYTTAFNRTELTARPLAKRKGMEFTVYEPKDLEYLVTGMLDTHWSENAIVVGHSNSTPNLINRLLQEDTLEPIPEDEYDHIYFIEREKGRPAKLYSFHY